LSFAAGVRDHGGMPYSRLAIESRIEAPPGTMACAQMVASRLDAVYVTYWSLRDPLCLSQSLPVVRDLRRRGWRMALVTFEQEPWVLPPEERQETRAGLSREGIEWVPLSYHKRPAVVSTLFDIAVGAVRCAALARR